MLRALAACRIPKSFPKSPEIGFAWEISEIHKHSRDAQESTDGAQQIAQRQYGSARDGDRQEWTDLTRGHTQQELAEKTAKGRQARKPQRCNDKKRKGPWHFARQAGHLINLIGLHPSADKKSQHE